MYARVTTLEVPPERTDEALRHVREQLIPKLQQHDGYKGFIVLGDRHSGKLRGLVLWENEEAFRASISAAATASLIVRLILRLLFLGPPNPDHPGSLLPQP